MLLRGVFLSLGGSFAGAVVGGLGGLFHTRQRLHERAHIFVGVLDPVEEAVVIQPCATRVFDEVPGIQHELPRLDRHPFVQLTQFFTSFLTGFEPGGEVAGVGSELL